MPLPEQLERLKQISLDALGLSESTQAVLKWYGIVHTLDCIALFYLGAQERHTEARWPWFFTLLFAEVKPKLIAAGYWDLVLDADVWRVFVEEDYEPDMRQVVRWQGRDQDLRMLPFEELGLSHPPESMSRHFKSIASCIDHFLRLFAQDSENWLEIGKYDPQIPAPLGRAFDEYLWGVVQPRLVEMGLWAFVEAHLDDFDLEDDEDEDDFRDFLEDDDGQDGDDFEIDDIDIDDAVEWHDFETDDEDNGDWDD